MQIQREGSVSFGEARLAVWEEGIPREWDARADWERKFKHDVFKRIIQTLNRIGWVVGEQTHIFTDNDSRYCTKGDLQADLRASGRMIELEFFQSVNTPDRADHGGRYQSDKELHMPYLARLEMERTRRRIRDYLCNVFTGYTFDTKRADGRGAKVGIGRLTALEFIAGCYETSWHFKGDPYKSPISECNSRSRDGKTIEHGSQVYYTDWKGRVLTGTAYYNINNMWWVASGRYGYNNKSTFEIYVESPGDLRTKRNESRRRKRLEDLMSTAVAAMDFKRAEVVRNILWPAAEPLFMVWHEGHSAYHRSGFSGYSASPIEAGKFTKAEIKGWSESPNKIVPVGAAA
ncbi:hypothetical protein Pfra02_04020 [Pseudomonas fragi]|nr:hypothetical protein Pfra02_04020 [Pseudomonas fragi]